MPDISDDTIRDITSTLIDGLTTDGADQKQWALEEALRLLAPDEFYACKANWGWEDGVAL